MNKEIYLLEKTKQYISNKNWYNKSNKIIKSKFKDDYILFIKILAITSPRNTVKRNTFLALKTYDYIKTNKKINFSYGIANKQIKRNVSRVIDNKSVGGIKVNSFINSLLLKNNAICLDIWMFRAFNLKNNKTNREKIRNIVKRIAKKLNIETYQVQSCLWVYAKNELNKSVHKEYKDFTYYLKFNITLQSVLRGI